MDKEVKNIQHADALKNIDSVHKALETIGNFCIHADSKININKTECILLGPLKSLFDELNGIRVTNGAVKCLGIYIGPDKECYNKNWMKVYHDAEKLFESIVYFWKITIINTLSKLFYIANI